MYHKSVPSVIKNSKIIIYIKSNNSVTDIINSINEKADSKVIMLDLHSSKLEYSINDDLIEKGVKIKNKWWV